MEHYLEQLDMGELMGQLDSFFPEAEWDAARLFSQVRQGDWNGAAAAVWENLAVSLGGQAEGMKGLLVSILILGVLSVLVTAFLSGFDNPQTAQVGYAVFYLLLLSVLFRIFAACYEAAGELLTGVGQFAGVLFPALCLSLSLSAGSLTAAGYYQIAVFLIALSENLLVRICLPALAAYMLLVLMNGIWEEGKLSALMDLTEKAVHTVMKLSVSAVTGLGVLQSMVAPVLDGLKRTAVSRTVAVIPGIGDLAEGTTRLLLGSAVLVKNSLGVLGLLLLAALMAVPCCKLFLYGLLLKLGGALIGVAADKRLTGCCVKAGDAIWLLLKLCLAGAGGFVVLVAVIICVVGKGVL